MSTTQIWVFGILAFIVLIVLVEKVAGNRSHKPWPIARQDDNRFAELAATGTDATRAVEQQLAAITADLVEVKTTLESIEQTLKVVE